MNTAGDQPPAAPGTPRKPLHARVSEALDAAGDLQGDALLNHIRAHHANDPEVIAEICLLFAESNSDIPVLDSEDLRAARTSFERMHSIFAQAANSQSGERRPKAADRAMPETLGQYRVLRVVGEGGMGIVYEAEQPSPKRRVALKVIASGLASKSAIARFRHEAQILGQLKHPGIAQIYEAGTDPVGGDAFFAMEFIEGTPLNTFCDSKALATAARIELLAKVCDAVQHAHTKGVIHRDLKPGNILVEVSDTGEPQPKVLDFGVAKLTAADEPSATLALDAGRIVGTLGYMSPEQFSAKPEDVDTRSDVYALGVVLYQLLAGKPPIDVKGTSIAEAARRVAHDNPEPLERVNPKFRGDLDTIVGKALRKDREDRYASAAELAADLRRFLTHQPISARPPGTLYVLGKFARRNKGLTSAAAAGVACLVIGLVVSLWQYRQAEYARERAVAASILAAERSEQAEKARAEEAAQRKAAEDANALATAVKNFMLYDIIQAANPMQLGYDAKLIDAVNRAAEQVEARFKDRPLVLAEIRAELGNMYGGLGQREKAIEQARESAKMFEALLGPDDEMTIRAITNEAIAQSDGGQNEQAEPLLRNAAARADRALAKDNEQRLRLLNSLANVLQSRGATGEAETIFAEIMPLAQSALPRGNDTRIAIQGNYIVTLMRKGKNEEALELARPHLDDIVAVNGAAFPSSLAARNNLIALLTTLKRYDEALVVAEPAPALAAKTFPSGHPARAIMNVTVAGLMTRVGRIDDAKPLFDTAIQEAVAAFGEFHWQTERIIGRALDVAVRRKDTQVILDLSRRAVRIRLGIASDGEGESISKVVPDNAAKRKASGAIAADLAGPLALLKELAAPTPEELPTDHPLRAVYFANLARAAAFMGEFEIASRTINDAEAALPTSADRERVDKILAITRGMLARPADPAPTGTP
jgi:eukaryotic-like serine/threonine-protein kinase